jgi:hypothetical protein
LEDDAAWRAHGLHSWRVSPCIYAQTSFPIKLIHTKKLGVLYQAEIPDSDYQWLMCDATDQKEKHYSQANGELSGIFLPRMTISHRPRFVISSSIS